jgi:hypothetical protein
LYCKLFFMRKKFHRLYPMKALLFFHNEMLFFFCNFIYHYEELKLISLNIINIYETLQAGMIFFYRRLSGKRVNLYLRRFTKYLYSFASHVTFEQINAFVYVFYRLLKYCERVCANNIYIIKHLSMRHYRIE